MEDVKTLWQLLQEVVEKEDKYYSLYDFITEENSNRRKDIRQKLERADNKQFYEYMDAFHFVNSDEIYMAVSEYYEKVMNRPLCMWECGDMYEIAEDYMRERNLNFDEE